jgi:hypothetical protein
VGGFEYKVRERDAAGHDRRAVGTYAHAAGEDPPAEGAVIVVYGKMWRVVEVREEKTDAGAETLLVEPFADPG